jgi:Ser-tRNA(Ala) deacylase AlaX
MYLSDPDTFSGKARVICVGQDARGDYVILDQTLFYPQGGGQPADQGQIRCQEGCFQISDVRKVEGQVRHYGLGQLFAQGQDVVMHVLRRLHTAYHTAGHLIAGVIEKNYALKAVKGHQFPGQAHVVFEGNDEKIDIAVPFRQQIAEQRVVQVSVWPISALQALGDVLPTDFLQEKMIRCLSYRGVSPCAVWRNAS